MAARIDYRWWDKPEHRAHETVCAVAEHIDRRSRARYEAHRTHVRLYGGAKYAGLRPGEYTPVPASQRVSINIVQACINTYVAKMVKNRPAPRFVTNKAGFDLRRRAKKLDLVGKGLVQAMRLHDLAPIIERDAAMIGTGLARPYRDGDSMRAERILPWEFLVDEVEGYYGEPRTAYLRRFVERDVLLARYGDDEDARAAIERAGPATRSRWGRPLDTASDPVVVVEAWRLGAPGREDEVPGRHVIATERGTILDEPWERTRIPVVVRRWEDPPVGWWGIGVAERLTGLQLEITKLLRRTQQADHLLGRPLVEKPAGVDKAHLTNEVGVIVENASADSIKVHTWPTMPPDTSERLRWYIAQGYEEVGISRLSATSHKPAGLDSGVALREYHDIETERFAVQGQRHEQWHLDMVLVALEEIEHTGGLTVEVGDEPEIELTSEDAGTARTQYALECYPVSQLPQTPAGRLEFVRELTTSGLVTEPARVLDLLGWPDIEELKSEESASLDAIRQRIDAILDGEGYESPEPMDDIALALRVIPRWYLRARTDGAPPERLAEVRRWYEEAIAILRSAQPGNDTAAGAAAPAEGQVAPAPDPMTQAARAAAA